MQLLVKAANKCCSELLTLYAAMRALGAMPAREPFMKRKPKLPAAVAAVCVPCPKESLHSAAHAQATRNMCVNSPTKQQVALLDLLFTSCHSDCFDFFTTAWHHRPRTAQEREHPGALLH